jgi:[ribosomal protein S5]-alanine N-acetyltransferase
MTTVHLQTARLILRTVTSDDIEGVMQCWNLDGPPISHEEATGRVQWMLANYERNAAGRLVHLCLAIVHRETGQIIGWCGLDHRDATQAYPVLFYLLQAAHRGQGFATEAARAVLDYAFGELALPRVDAGAAVDNVASVRILEKIGMQRLGLDEEGGQAFSLAKDEFLRM